MLRSPEPLLDAAFASAVASWPTLAGLQPDGDALGWAASLGYSARDAIAELAMELDEGLQH